MNDVWARDLAGALAAWRQTAGDMTVVGWAITAGYLAAAWLCGVCALRHQTGSDARLRRVFWGVMAACVFVLGANKQLDLQTVLVQIGRVVALWGGWHDHRRLVQAIFAVVLAGGTGGVAVAGGLVFRSLIRPFWAAWVGLGALLLYVILRAALFMHLGERPFLPLPGHHSPVYPLLEAGGVAFVIVSALWQGRRAEGPAFLKIPQTGGGERHHE